MPEHRQYLIISLLAWLMADLSRFASISAILGVVAVIYGVRCIVEFVEYHKL